MKVPMRVVQKHQKSILAAVGVLVLCVLGVASATAQYQAGNVHVFYQGETQHIYGGLLNSGSFEDITSLTGAPDPASLSSPITGFADASGDHVFFAASNQHVYQLYYEANLHEWTPVEDITTTSGAPVAAGGSSLSGFSDTPGEHVIYLGTNNHVYQLYYNFNAHEWGYGDLTSITGNIPAAAGSPLSSYFDSNGEHIFFLGTNHHVYQLWFEDSANKWVPVEDLTAAAGAPVAQSGSSLAAFNDDSSQDRVFYEGTNEHIYELFTKTGGTWVYGDLTSATGAAAAVSGSPITAFPNPQVEYVLYLGPPVEDGGFGQVSPLYELFYNGATAWTNYNILADWSPDGVAVGTKLTSGPLPSSFCGSECGWVLYTGAGSANAPEFIYLEPSNRGWQEDGFSNEIISAGASILTFTDP